MSRHSKSDTEPDDADLAALFKAQSSGPSGAPPAELDELIVSAATAAVQTDPGNRQSHDQHQRKTLSKSVTGWFAVAATVVLGISVAPLVLRAPESALDLQPDGSYYQRASEPVADTSLARQTETQANAKTSKPPNPSASSLALEAAPAPEAEISEQAVRMRLENPSSLLSPDAVSITNEEASVQSTLGAGNGGAAGDIPAYRNTVNSWITEIHRLLNDDQAKAAALEFMLFRSTHPDVPVGSTLDELKLPDNLPDNLPEQ